MSPAFTSAASLVQFGLLSQTEFTRLKAARKFPPDFAKRVIHRFGGAVPVSEAANVASEKVFWVDAFNGPAPPIRTYDGPFPQGFRPWHIPRYPVVLHDARGARMFVGHKASTLLMDAGHYYKDVSSENSEWITPAFAEAGPDIVLDGTAAVLFANGASLYSHWMFDLLPKFDVLKRAGWTDERVDYYILNSCRAPYCLESLARLGVDRKKIVNGTGQLISATRLLVPSPIRWKFWTPEWAREFVATTFLNGQHRSDGIGEGERIYISRANARRRRVTNEQEVRDILKSRQFSVVLAEEMGISRLAALIRRAGSIVAPHGAGVTNVAFAGPGIRVLELFGAHIATEGWLMTNGAKGKHFILAGMDSAGRYPWQAGAYENFSLAERNAADYAIDGTQLSKALDIMER